MRKCTSYHTLRHATIVELNSSLTRLVHHTPAHAITNSDDTITCYMIIAKLSSSQRKSSDFITDYLRPAMAATRQAGSSPCTSPKYTLCATGKHVNLSVHAGEQEHLAIFHLFRNLCRVCGSAPRCTSTRSDQVLYICNMLSANQPNASRQ